MKDSKLKQDVIDEIEFEPSIDANDIGVAVEDGVVTLSGHVPNYSQKLAIEKAVARVKGVRGIAQELQVRYPGSVSTADDEVAKRVINTLKWHSSVPDEGIQVKVQDGWVTLSGRVDWNYQKIGAADAIRHLHGVTGVSNLIELVPHVTPSNVKQTIENALKRNAELEAERIKVTVDGGKVTLEGTVKAWSERIVAEDAAWAMAGVTSVDDRLSVLS
jgi:osmotically-inducible protein OsmY